MLPPLSYSNEWTMVARMNDERELSEATFWIMTALAGGRRHGYAILQETVEASDRRVTLKVATLYAALERLAATGWVEADGDEIVDGRTRRYFRLTDPGRVRLEAEVERIEQRARFARARLRPGLASIAMGGAW